MTDHATNNDTETLVQWLWEHEHRHVSSNNPGGHLCSRSCLAEALMRSRWRRDRDADVAAQAKADLHQAWGVGKVDPDGHVNPSQVEYASGPEGAQHKAEVLGLTVVTRWTSEWRAAVAVPEPEEEQ